MTTTSAGVRSIVFGTDREKLLFAFRVHDHDGDGLLDPQEVHRMIALALIEGAVGAGDAVAVAQRHVVRAWWAAGGEQRVDRAGDVPTLETLAAVQFLPAMIPADLQKADLVSIGKKWA